MKPTPEILERAVAACEQRFTSTANPGICLSCGADADGVEPDARRRECDECGSLTVYGCEEICIMGLA